LGIWKLREDEYVVFKKEPIDPALKEYRAEMFCSLWRGCFVIAVISLIWGFIACSDSANGHRSSALRQSPLSALDA